MKQENKTIILFLSADPTDAARLRLGQEQREIQEKLQLARMRDEISLEVRSSVRPGDMIQALHDTNPRIVHFSGHGTEVGEICLEDELGKIHPVTPEALSSLFRLVKAHVDCVVLNACYSEIQAKAIAKHIDYVIGMSRAIGDEAAIAFSTGFYRALGAGRTIDDAFNFGTVELRLMNIPEHLTPVIIRKRKSSRKAAGTHPGTPRTHSELQLQQDSAETAQSNSVQPAKVSPCILVVDDDLATLSTIEKSLTDEGFIIHTANSHGQALQEINQHSFDLIILDIIMPDWTGRLSKRAGLDILSEIKARGLTTPVVMLSAQEEIGLAIEAIQYEGAKDYLVKGDIGIKEFVQRIRRHLDTNSTLEQ